MPVGNTALAEEPPEQESSEVSSGKSDSKISQLLLDSVGEAITVDPSDGGALVAAQARSTDGTARDELSSAITKAEILSSETVDDLVRFDRGGNVEVYIHLESSDEAAFQQVRDAVVRVEVEDTDHGIVQAWVAPQDLGAVASLGAVRRITPPDYGYTKEGSTLTEGDAAHRSNLARAFGGLTGDGVKVGVISDGVNAWRTARARGDLPARIEINPKNAGGGDEGTALLEIVHDLAPDAELAFSAAGSSLWMVQAILWLANDAFGGEGADVIVDDLGFYFEPSFEDGIVAQAAADAVAGGAVFVSAAGNSAQRHYEADFVDSGDGFHAFDGSSDIAMRLHTTGGVFAILQWNDRFGSSGNDYDLYACPAGLRPTVFNLLNEICAGSTDLQNGDDDPVEAAFLGGVSDVDVFIERVSGQPRRLEMFTLGAHPREYGVREGGIVHHPAVPGVLAVGAFDEDDPGQDDVESFSDLGPSRIYFPTVQTRLKPDVVAADGVSVTGSGGFSSHFSGTSAAAPHVAGIAALIIEAQRLADPSMTKKNVADAATGIIRSSATDLGPAGHDVEFGYGRANALAAVESLGPLAATTFTVDSTGDGADSDSRDGVCDDGNGNCTLRAAIAEVNRADTSIIEFDISGSGTQTIQPASALPLITKTVFIDGFSQPGAGSGTFRIQLDGTNAGAAADGLRVSGKQSRIRGLVINRFGGNGIEFVGSGGGQFVEENRIGVSVSGTSDLGNGDAGVHVSGAPGVIVQDNLISGNDSHGVSISGSTAREVVLDGNLVGTNAAGTGDLGNSGSGVHVSGAGDASISSNVIAGNDSHGVALTGSGTRQTQIAENHIGTTAAGSSLPNGGSGVHIGGGADDNVVSENVIAHNTADGVTVVSSSATGNTVWENSVHSNGGLGIDLNDDGVTANDSNDADNGPNNLQNHPVLRAAGLSSDAGSIAFDLHVTENIYIVDFYASDSCDGSGSGEGKDWLGFALVVPATLGARHYVADSFEGTLNDYQYSSGSHITATVTVDGSTSEFSPCIRSSSLPRLTLSEDSVEVEEGGTTQTTYTVRLSSRPSHDATVDVSVRGDAVVTVSPETLPFTTGTWANAQTVTVTAVGDADPVDEATTLLHTLTIDGKKYGAGLLPVEVSDGDAAILSFKDDGSVVRVGVVVLNEGASFTYPVVLTEEPDGETRIAVSGSDSSALTVSPPTLTFDKDNYDTAQNVTITARTDADAADSVVGVYHETRIGGRDYVLGLILAVIVDSGLPDFTFSEEGVSVNEGETATYTVVPESEPSTGLTVQVDSSDTDSVTVSPPQLTFTVGTSGNWATPQTVTVTGVADDDGFNDRATIEHAVRHSGTEHDVGEVDVTVVDNNRAPFFEEGLKSTRAVPENSTEGTRVGEPVVATDLDGDVLTYSIGRESGGSFDIDATGQIVLSGTSNDFDFETPTDRSVEVIATDPGGLSDSIEVEIVVTDVNEPPEVSGRDALEFEENRTGSITRYTAADPERDAFGWSVGGSDGGFFSLDDRGYLSLEDPVDFEARADADGDNVYQLVVTATDTAGNAGNLDASVTIEDANEAPGVVGRNELAVDENDETFSEFYRAIDPEGAVISRWSLSGSDAGDFTISEGGELSFRNVPDFERPVDSNRDNVYEVSVRASDGRNYGYLEVTVTVEDINEPPDITTTSRTEFTYRENATATIYTFSASDPEQGTVLWLLGGPDGDDFTVTGDSRGRGVLTFTNPPDYENPTDAGGDNEYQVTVQARDDAFNTASLEVTVTVTDDNEGPEISGAQSLTFSENLQEGRVLATYAASDPEGAAISRWSLSGSDAGDFTISEGGELSFRNVPDFERPADSNRDNVYEVSVRASDGRNYGYLEVTVTVEEFNEAPTITTTSRTEFTYRENATATIYTFSATDPERADISWSLSGPDDDDFTVTGDSRGRGVLTFTNPPDYENPTDAGGDNEYQVTVQARDDAFNTASLEVTVTVTDDNEGPEISGTQSLTFSENLQEGRVLATYSATDPEDPGTAISRWSVSGRDGGDFAISEGGELSFRNVPDFERPADSGRDNVYNFSVRASDGRNYGYLEVTVTVEDINEAPTITTTSRTEFTYRENATATIYTFSASDPEGGTVLWLLGGPDGDDFTVTGDSRGRGVLTFTNPPDYENPTDAGGDNEYQVTVQARDDAFNTASLEVTVTVTDDNEGPEISGAQSLTFSENLQEGRVLATYAASDPEGAAISRWSLSGSDAGDFTISEGGELSFRNVPDFERPADSNRDNEYLVTVRASDGRYYGYLEVTVTVEDINEAPDITTTSRTAFTYRENATATIYTFSATDPERADISWSLSGPDDDDFTVTGDSRGRGVLTFTNPPDYENPTDAGGDNEYQVTVQARDDAFNTASLEVTVTVTDDNEGPEISGTQSLTFSENLQEGRVLATYAAIDPEDPGAATSRWSLSGSDAGDFTISEGGELSFRNVPDFERPADSGRDNVYNFSVRASDGRNYGYLEVTVTVEDINEAPDITTTSRTEFTYRENATATIYTFSATDPERADISWSLSGPDDDDFTVTGDSRGRGVLTFTNPPDYENPTDAGGDNEYQVTVQARDDAFNTASLEVTVTVTDDNEGPEISGTQSLTFSENLQEGRVLATYAASDPEGAAISRWSLSGSDAGDFTISEGGELSFRNVPDFERPADSNRDNEYLVTVRASDGRYYGYLEVTVTVENINEAPDITTTSRTEFTYRENATATIYTFSATDPEQGTVLWLLSGPDGDDFTVTGDSRGRGVLAFRNPPDYENPTDAGGDNEYQVTVQARDDAFNTASLEVTVTVTDDNEGPEISGTQSLTFSENLQEGRVLATYAATDPEDPGAAISRWSVSGRDGGDFTISEGGELSFRNVPDFERPADSNRDNVYEVSVRASDGRNYGYLEVTVTVEDINEAPDITTTSRTEFTYRENATATIYTFSATDPEQGTVLWLLSGPDDDDFAIYRGTLTFKTLRDFESPADADGDNEYEVTVVATDDDGHADSLAVTVTVTGQNEGPEISGPQSLSFAENQATDRILAAYTATDPEDPSAVITRWSLSGSDAGDFAISETGELSFRNVPDFERPADSGRDNVYNFSVRASDGRNYGYLEVTVTVNDINEALAITTTSRTEFTYRENATATIYTFSAADPEQGQVTWSPGGADGDDFAITADSRGRGVLTFTNPPDYENPTDAGGDNEYQVTVQARDDAFNTASLEVTVTVTDDNEGPEISGTQSLTFSENLQEGRVLATYSAIDPEDPSAVITRWSLSGSDAGDFAINETGELSFRNVPDYERPADSGRDNVYNFSVRASDGRNYGYLEVTVTVNDINEALAITTTSRTEFTYRENGTATIYTFSAADPEQGQVTWSPGGADGDDFAITADSRGRGVLAFTNPPDFENPTDSDRDNDYQVTVEATDDDGHTDTLDVAVTVSDQSEGPEISGPQSLSFTENLEESRILAAYTAIDPEDPSAVITRWSLSGSDAGDFAINENGELSFRNVPDYERPADSGRDNVYNFSVRASDGRNYGYLEVTVVVNDINEALAITTTSRTEFTYRENATATIYTFSAADPEQGQVTWSPGGADGDDFAITADSRGRGVLAFTNPPDFESPADADRDNVYEVTVEATDDDGHTDSLAVTVTVTAQSEGPEIAGPQSLSFAENQATDRILATYSAIDPEDPSAVITRWSLSGSDAGDFAINETGELSFRNVPDYERPADSGRDNVYKFSVRASDGRNYGYLEVTVTVNDINEALAITTTSRTEFTYRENGTATIYTFSAADPEQGQVTWSPGGADGDDFAITADSRGRGVLAFTNPPDFENPTDSDRDNDYQVTVEATDDDGHTDTLDVAVTVSDQSEGPEISGPQSLSFAENQATDRILATYTAIDPEDPGTAISRWSLSGRDGGDFAINETGELSFRNVPDYERPADSGRDNVYNFSVRASDGRNYGYLEVTVTVNDINEALAITTTSRTEFTYRENATATIYTFSAADPEQGQVTWSPGGADGDDFAITADTRGRGVLTFTNPPDFENPTDANRDNDYQVTVEATDDDGHTDSLAVTVTVTAQSEGPEIAGPQSLSFTENLEESRILAAYTAIDPEDPSAVITRWSLSGSDAGDFAINENGELSFRNVPDYERPADSGRDNVYNFSVRASDGRNYGYLEVTVTVNDINEAPDMTGSDRIAYQENGTDSLATYRATDPERGTISWNLSGPDRDDFAISDTGVLAFNNPPDYEQPSDSDGNNVYEVTVEAADPEATTAFLEVTVTVTNQTD